MMRDRPKIRAAARTLMSAVIIAAAAVCADDDYGLPSVYGDMAGEVLVSPRSAALSLSDLAVNHAGPIASNPALSARAAAPELTLGYSSYYGDVFSASVFNYTGRAGPHGGISATAAYLLIPGIEDTRNVDTSALDRDDIRIFTASDIWARVAYGHGFKTKRADIYAGAAVTARRRRLDPETSAYGLGADLGVTAHLRKPSVHAALILENVRHSVVNWQSSDYTEKIPQHLRLSLAFEHEDQYIYGRIAFFYTSPDLLFNEGINSYGEAADREEGRLPEVRTLSDGPGILLSAGRYGVEYTIMQTLSLRAGVSVTGFSMGAGLNLLKGRAGVDLCYLNHELAGSVMASVTYRWL